MNPSWVLSDDQRKKRFKKYRENNRESSGQDSVSSPDSASTELDLSDNIQQSPTLPTLHERNSTRRRVKSAPDRASAGMMDTPPRGRGAGRKYSSKQGVNKGHGLGLHCGASSGSIKSASASQPVSPVDSICSLDFSQTWAFPDVVKSEPDDSSSYLDSMKHDIQEPQGVYHVHHQHQATTTSPIKLEPDGHRAYMYTHRQTSVDTSCDYEPLTVKEELEVDPEQVDKLQDLINSVDFATIKTINEIVDNAEASCNSVKHVYQHQPESGYQSDFYPVTPEADPIPPPNFPINMPAHHNGNGTDLADDDPLAVMKLEMAFLNSNQSFPARMSEETSFIWEQVVASCNFNMLNNASAASNILNEAVELALKRNLIFLEENPDFTSLSLELRTQLYINNMGKMCHVRGLLHQIGGGRFQQAGYGGGITPNAHMGTNFMWTSHADNGVQISYKDPRTGKLRNFMGRDSGGFGGGNVPVMHDDDRDTLLALAEEVSRLELNVVPFTIILLMVLFHLDNSNTPYADIVNTLQTKYVNMLYRYIQSNYVEDRAKKCIHVLLKFVFCLIGKFN